MKADCERPCYACGAGVEPPFTEVALRSGAPAIHKGAVAVLCIECAEKIEADARRRTPDAPV